MNGTVHFYDFTDHVCCPCYSDYFMRCFARKKLATDFSFRVNGHQLLFEYVFDCTPSRRIVGCRRLRAAPQISGTQRRPKDLWTPKFRRARAQAFVDARTSCDLGGCGPRKCHKDSWAPDTCAPDPRCSWTIR